MREGGCSSVHTYTIPLVDDLIVETRIPNQQGSLGGHSYRLSGEIVQAGFGGITDRRFYMGDSAGEVVAETGQMYLANVDFEATTGILTNGNTHWYKAQATDGSGQQGNGGVVAFTVPAAPPPLVTLSMSTLDFRNPTASTATATLLQLGSAPTEIFFQYQNPKGDPENENDWVTATSTSPGHVDIGDTFGWDMRDNAGAHLFDDNPNTFIIRACATDSGDPERTACSAPTGDLHAPTGILELDSLTSCLPDAASGGSLVLKHTYTGSESFTQCHVLKNDVVDSTVSVPLPNTNSFNDTNPVFADYEVRCDAASGGSLYSDVVTFTETCSEPQNLLMSVDGVDGDACIAMDQVHVSPYSTVSYWSPNGVAYSSCTATMTRGDLGVNPFVGPQIPPDIGGAISYNTEVRVALENNPDLIVGVGLSCIRSFDGQEQIAYTTAGTQSSISYPVCHFDSPSIGDFRADPDTVSLNSPTTTIYWEDLAEVNNCQITGVPAHDPSTVTFGPYALVDPDEYPNGSLQVTQLVSMRYTIQCDSENAVFGALSKDLDICYIEADESLVSCDLDLDPRFEEG